MANKNSRKGDALLGFGVLGIIIGLLLFRAPIGVPALLVGLICLACWFFVRSQSNKERQHQETLAAMQAQLDEERRRNNQG